MLTGILKKNLKRLQRQQNMCAKLVCLKPKFEHVSPLQYQFHWLPVCERIVYKTLLCVYKSMEGLSAQYIQYCLIVKRREEGAMRTRSSGSTNFVVPVSKKCAGDRAFLVVIKYQMCFAYSRKLNSTFFYNTYLLMNYNSIWDNNPLQRIDKN